MALFPEDLITMANELLQKFGCDSYIENLEQCDHHYFVSIYEAMLGERLPGLTSSPTCMEDEVHNVQVVIDSLATDILGIDLSHIDAQSVVEKNLVHIQNLLEIFDGLLEYVYEELEGDDQKEITGRKEEEVDKETENEDDNNVLNEQQGDDSNVFPRNHGILSEVFLEEFGKSYSTSMTQQNKGLKDTDGVHMSPSKPFTKEILTQKDNYCEVDSTSSSDRFTWSKHGTDSTKELITEAELIEKEKALKSTDNVIQTMQNNAKLSTYENNDQWSSILTQTSSAVESIAGIEELGIRPRRKLPVEKQKSEKDSKQKVKVHRHLHHHYYHRTNDSPSTSSDSNSSSSLSSYSTNGNRKLEKASSQQTSTIQSTETQTPELIDTAIQTNILRKGSKNLHIPLKHNKYAESIPNHVEYLQELKQTPVVATETRSKQLSDLSLRLKKIRGQFSDPVQQDTTASKATDTLEPKIKYKAHKSKMKNGVRVSFATEAEEHEFYSSDTEIDYSSPIVTGKSRQKKKIESPTRSILIKNKPRNGSGTSESDDADIVQSKSITAKFEEPFLKRDQRLLELQRVFKRERLESEKNVNKLKSKYIKQHRGMIEHKKEVTRQSNLQLKENRKKTNAPILEVSPTKCRRKPLRNSTNARLANIYGEQKERSTKTKPRKRSASASPVRRSRRKTPMIIEEDEILPIMEEEFPFIYLSPRSAKMMWQKQMRQLSTLRKVAYPHKSTKTQRRLEEAQQKQEALTRIMKKELEHNKRLKEYKERQYDEKLVKCKLDERRQRAARARRYYKDYVIQNKARMLKKRTKEEKIFKQLFSDGLQIQKQRIREMREYTKEQKEKNAKKQQNELESLENYYRDQFSMLAESVAQDRYESEVKQKAQSKVLYKMRSEMRHRMENDIKEIQEQLADDDDATYFRQLDADNLKREFQLAMYKTSELR